MRILIIVFIIFILSLSTYGCEKIKFQKEQKYKKVVDAVKKADYTAVEKLLDEGASINEPDEEGYLPIHIAAGMGDIKMLNILLERGADIESWGEYYGLMKPPPPICHAVEGGKIEAVKFLMYKGANINTQCEFLGGFARFGFKAPTPLILASLLDKPDIFELLLRSGAEIDVDNLSLYRGRIKNPYILGIVDKILASHRKSENIN